MTETEQTEVTQSASTYGFEGGSISLVPAAVYDINGKTVNVPPHIAITESKPSGKPTILKIIGKNAYDSILRVLKSRKGQEFRNSLADTLSLETLD